MSRLSKKESRQCFIDIWKWIEVLEKDDYIDVAINGHIPKICEILQRYGLCSHDINHDMTNGEWADFKNRKLKKYKKK